MLKDITQNPFLRKDHERLRGLLLKRIPQLRSCPVDAYLSLAKYFRKTPWQFFDPDSYHVFLSWLESQDSGGRLALQEYIHDNLVELNGALRNLDEVNRYSWHDISVPRDDMDIVRLLDQHVHPAYLRLSEGVWTPLLRMPAHFSRLARKKSSDGLDAFNIIEELKNGPLACVCTHVMPTIRNGIAHGDTEFRDHDIRYRDKRGNEALLSGREMIQSCDDLLDACNGLALGIAVFLLSRQPDGYVLPQQLLFEELCAQTECSWWSVDACIPAIRSDHSQLTIYVRADTYDRRKAEYAEFQTGILAGILAPGYDRYFLSIRSSKAKLAMAAFKGAEIQKLKGLPNCRIEDCGGIVDDGLFGYLPKIRLPRIMLVLGTFLTSFHIHWPYFKEDMRKHFARPVIKIRGAETHLNGWRRVVNGQALIQLPEGEEVTDKVVRRFKKRIVRQAFKAALRRKSRLSPVRYLPLGYATISVFRKDYRGRRLSGFGLGSDLIGTIQMKRISRIKAPDIIGSTIEQHGSYRIAWNRAWLDEHPPATT